METDLQVLIVPALLLGLSVGFLYAYGEHDFSVKKDIGDSYFVNRREPDFR